MEEGPTNVGHVNASHHCGEFELHNEVFCELDGVVCVLKGLVNEGLQTVEDIMFGLFAQLFQSFDGICGYFLGYGIVVMLVVSG